MGSNMSRAFTLVELSIVLVILGLLTGGILTGQSLIRAAELRSIVVEKDRYVTAAQTFRDRYMALPGDLVNARRFWGDGTTTVALCETPAGEPAHYDTCNGNGDGKIAYVSWNSLYPQLETIQFWRHLALAGLIEGNYSGESSLSFQTTSSDATYGGVVIARYYNEVTPTTPTSRAMNMRWFTAHNPHMILFPGMHGALTFRYNYGNYLLHGNAVNSGGALSHSYTSTLKPEEVWNIDNKTDDGKAGVGKVIVYPVGCTTAADETQGSTAEYLLTSATGQCGVIFSNAF